MRRPAGGGGLLGGLLLSVLLVAAYVGVDRFQANSNLPEDKTSLQVPSHHHRLLCAGTRSEKLKCERSKAAREGRDPNDVTLDDIDPGGASSEDGPQPDTPVRKKKRSSRESSDASFESADSFSVSKDDADNDEEKLSAWEKHKRNQNKYKMQQETQQMKEEGLSRWERHKKRNDPGYMSTKEMKELGMSKWERHKARQNGETVGGAAKRLRDRVRRYRSNKRLTKDQKRARKNQKGDFMNKNRYQSVPNFFKNADGSTNTGPNGWNLKKGRERRPRPMTEKEERQKKIDDAISKQRKQNWAKEYADGG